MLDTSKIKNDFPIFRHTPGLVYLDSTATSLKPISVIKALRRYYEEYSANIFRGIYRISELATAEYEGTREAVATFINASNADEIIFTRNTTESLNLIVYSYVLPLLKEEDEIVSTILEHHSNFVPWQQAAIIKRAKFKVVGLKKNGDLEDIDQYITDKTRALSLTHVSNVLGTVIDVSAIIAKAKKINPNIIVVVDAAQAVPHRKVDVSKTGADFIAFSSHKMLGPTGVGVLWGKKKLLDAMRPFLYGGEMIREVYRERSEFKDSPHKFEAGTPSIGEVIALKEAVSYLNKIGMKNIEVHEKELGQIAVKRLREEFPDIHIVGPHDQKKQGGIVSFYFEEPHPHDIAQILSENEVCVRAGNHCAMPLHTELKIDATLRASFYLYNDTSDIEKLITGLHRALKVLKYK